MVYTHSYLAAFKVILGSSSDKGTPTCRDCVGGNCTDNILPEILSAKKITSGYFSLFFSSKPEGKCSHGGSFDRTSSKTPMGGINKDDLSSSHGHLHQDAALVATNATVELLDDIRLAVGDVNFLRFMGISSSSVLCFVIDTTGSMSDDIEEAKRVSFSIIDSRRGTPEEPSAYILVPFNDPDFGPLTRTTNADEFKLRISALTPDGGGDEPEMCLSGLQLALTGASPSSQIFVFTDASAKDEYLKGTVLALIEKTHSVVTFMLTNVFSARRRRSSGIDVNQGQRFSSRMSGAASQLYQDLAQASGGQAIQVTKATLPQATNIIVDSTTSALVTVFQATRDYGKPESFSFMVDESLWNVTAYITGSIVTFTLQSPSGENQGNTELNGPLGTIQAVGNLYRVQLNQQVGLWTVNISSSQPYSLKVTGRSPADFIFMFVEKTNGFREGLVSREGRPLLGKNSTLYLTVSDSVTLTVTAVSLVEASGSQEFNGTVESLGRGNYLVSVDRVPEGQFSVRLLGLLDSSTRSSSTPFQRQSNTQLRASNLIVTAQANSTVEPGIHFSLPFTVANGVIGGTYNIQANDDHGFVQSFTKSLTLVNGSAQGSVILATPENTTSGTDVTLTITAESPDSGDSNYAVLRLSVITKVTDFSPPVCHIVSVSANCSRNCSLSTWELSANITDGNGTGVQSVSLRRGDGILHSAGSVGEGGVDVTEVLYSASCCSPDVELIAVDAVGNVGTCFYSVSVATAVPLPPPPLAPLEALPLHLHLPRVQLSPRAKTPPLHLRLPTAAIGRPRSPQPRPYSPTAAKAQGLLEQSTTRVSVCAF
uniref:von Willebrand factor A domain-containing protein 7-like n=1 Tax=Scleropages formosus TaxID=113540 RepID=A0A8C9RCE8_SCLFO